MVIKKIYKKLSNGKLIGTKMFEHENNIENKFQCFKTIFFRVDKGINKTHTINVHILMFSTWTNV